MTAVETLKIELDKILAARAECQGISGHILREHLERYRILTRKARAIREALEWMSANTACRAILLLCLLIAAPVNADSGNPHPDVIRTIALEASGEPYAGQVAVASVIKTRMARRGKSALEIIKQPYQFSCWDPATGRSTQKRTLTPAELDRATRAWQDASAGQFDHYAHHTIDNYWTRQAVESVRIGNHVFYRLGTR